MLTTQEQEDKVNRGEHTDRAEAENNERMRCKSNKKTKETIVHQGEHTLELLSTSRASIVNLDCLGPTDTQYRRSWRRRGRKRRGNTRGVEAGAEN